MSSASSAKSSASAAFRPGGAGVWFVALFALPFFGVGAGTTWWQWRDVLRSREILATWKTTPAYVESAELKSQHGFEGGSTYRAVGSFRYEADGRVFHSDALTLGGGSDNIGDFQQRLHREMLDALREGRPLVAYVNPADPAEAVLRPRWRVEMGLFKALFGVLFGGVGAVMLTGSILALASERAEHALRLRHPGEPWLWRRDWERLEVASDFGKSVTLGCIGLVVLNASTLPLWGALPAEWAAGGGFRWLLGAALLLVLAGDALCVRTLARVWRHRGVRLVLAESPLRPGAPFQMALFLPRGLRGDFNLTAELKCVHELTTGSGKQRRTERTTLWSGEEKFPGPFPSGHAIAFTPTPPADLPSAAMAPGASRHLWLLRFAGRGPGPDFVADFELPVFAKT